MQSDNTNERLRKYIIKLIAGNLSYSQEERKFRLSFRNIRQEVRQQIRDEIKKYPEWIGQTEANIDKFINNTILSASLCYNTRTVSYPTLDINNVKCGNIVHLSSKDDIRGESELKLMSIGHSENGIPAWLVLDSTLLAIHPEDVLEPYDTRLCSVGHKMAFKVYRDNKRIPKSGNKVFQTYPLTGIALEMPSLIHNIIDERPFTGNIPPGAVRLTTARSPMSLLLHDYSKQMPYYLDFSEDGETAVIVEGDYLGEIKVIKDSQELIAIKNKNEQ